MGVKDTLVAEVEKHLKKVEKGKLYPRTIPRFIAEAIQNQLERESTGSKPLV